ncbi:hypothetical protein EJB05_08941, partial [Eragrostis curvula]
MERGTHRFEVSNYILVKSFRTGEFIQSATFTIGGNDWCIRYLPNGDFVQEEDEDEEEVKQYVSVYLKRLSKTTEVRILCNITLINPATGLSWTVDSFARAFGSEDICGAKNFMERSALEADFVQDDCLVIEFEVTVVMGTPMSKSEMICEIQVPPSNVLDSLGNLLGDEKLADVTFMIKGEVFRAHKFVLAMRSPVFEAELYGPLRDKKMKTIEVEDMQPAVFKGLLHFIYKDSLPDMDDLDRDETHEMVKHLLVAADRYGMERMKIICESLLCKGFDVENVATTLILADQHHCSQLKDACIGFIKSSNRMIEVVASPGYACLKRACPAVTAEIWGKSAKSRKNRF